MEHNISPDTILGEEIRSCHQTGTSYLYALVVLKRIYMRVKVSFSLVVPHLLKGLNWSDTFGPKRAAPTVGGLLCRDIHISVAEIMHPLFLFVALRLFRDVVASKRIIYKKEPGVSIAERPDSAEQR